MIECFKIQIGTYEYFQLILSITKNDYVNFYFEVDFLFFLTNNIFQQAGIQLNKVFTLFARIMDGFDPFQLLESDSYVFHWGVSVAPKYYGLGVGLELELSSSYVGKACGISGSSFVFTSNYSQPFAEKLGCTIISELRYDEFKNEHGEVIIPNIVNGSKGVYVIWKYP